MSLLTSHVPHVAAPTSRCKTHPESTGKQEHPSRETSKPQHNPKCDAFRKGVAPMAPPSHVPNGLGFLPWMSTPGETRCPQQGKQHPTASPSPKLSPKDPQAQMPGQEADPSPSNTFNAVSRCPTEAPSDGRRRAGCPRQPQSCADLSWRGGPSDKAARKAGPDSTYRVTPTLAVGTSRRRRRLR